MNRLVVLAACLLAAGLSSTYAQQSLPPSPQTPVVTIGPVQGDGTAFRVLSAQHLAPASVVPIILIDPSGFQTIVNGVTDATGTLSVNLPPTAGYWLHGVSRAVLDLGGGRAISATFAGSDGKAHLYEQPDLPSPTSALHFVGSGLAPNHDYSLLVSLANGRGTRTVNATTDSGGILSAYLFPQQLGEPFLEAGPYQVSLPDLQLTAGFAVREHPVGPAIAVTGTAVAGDPLRIHLQGYRANRYIWATLADSSAHEQAEFLLGRTDRFGALDTAISLPQLAPGAYLLATPDDWGETSLSVVAPTPLPTDTPTLTPTSTPTPTSVPTATPLPTVQATHRVCKRNKHGRKHCKRVKSAGLSLGEQTTNRSH